MIVIAAIAIFVLEKTTVGRRFIATSVNPDAALTVGIRLDRYRVATYAVAGFCYAAAGVLLAGYVLSPTVFSGMPYLLATVAAVVVGGNPIGGGLRGSVAATIVGALLLTYLGQLVVSVGFATSAQNIVQAIIIIASVGIVEAGRRIRFEWIRFKFWVTSPDVEFRDPHDVYPHDDPPRTFQIAECLAGGQRALARRLCPTEEATRNHRMKSARKNLLGAPIMGIVGATKYYGPVQALKGVNLTIRRGQVHAVVGENGAGKSTLIGIAAGAVPPTSRSFVSPVRRSSAPTPGNCIAPALPSPFSTPSWPKK